MRHVVSLKTHTVNVMLNLNCLQLATVLKWGSAHKKKFLGPVSREPVSSQRSRIASLDILMLPVCTFPVPWFVI